jgi:hypothetical protein
MHECQYRKEDINTPFRPIDALLDEVVLNVTTKINLRSSYHRIRMREEDIQNSKRRHAFAKVRLLMGLLPCSVCQVQTLGKGYCSLNKKIKWISGIECATHKLGTCLFCCNSGRWLALLVQRKSYFKTSVFLLHLNKLGTPKFMTFGSLK